MEQYIVTGMSCAACQARVEKAVSKVEGVDSCSVSLLTNSMGVEGSASPEEIIRAVTDAGYGARLKADDAVNSASGSSYAADEAALEDRETPVLKKRLIWIARISASPHVLLHGAHDVGLASPCLLSKAIMSRWASCR